MTRTRLLQFTIRSRAAAARASQESWSDNEDSLGYQVTYPSTTENQATVDETSWSDCEDSMGYQVVYPPALKASTSTLSTASAREADAKDSTAPHSIPSVRTLQLDEAFTTISMGGILTKIPTRAMPAAHAAKLTYATTRPWSEEVALSGYASVAAATRTYATTRPWSEEVALQGYESVAPDTRTYATTRPWSDVEVLVGYEAADARKESEYATTRPWRDAEAMVGYAAGKGEKL